MMEKKNIWHQLFLRDDADMTESRIEAREALRSSLEQEYGLTVEQDNVTADELKELCYRRLTGNEVAHINQIFQYIPQFASSQINHRAVNAAFKAATEGSYRVRLDAGMHLCRSRLTPGAYRAVGLSDTTNQIAGNAELFANDAVLNVSRAPQIALGVFNVASLVTGQYFMSQVNTKLEALVTSVGKVEKLLDAQRHGELKTAEQELSDIMGRIEFIISDTDKTNASIAQIHDIQHIANCAMNTCQELLQNEIHEMDANDKVDRIKSRIEEISKNLVEYQYATQLYGIATLFELHLRNITDPDELRTYRDQIDRRVEQFKQEYSQCRQSTEEYLNRTHALNDRSFVQWITSCAVGVISVFITGWFNTGEKMFSLFDDLFLDHRKKKKEDIFIQANEVFEPLKDTVSLESPSSAINLYIETVGKEIEIVRIGDAYYTNLPEA